MIEFKGVGKTFRDGTAAVRDLNLVVPSGKITVIVGPSGCGKTTTLRMVNRMLEPTTGELTWDGNPLRSMRKTTLRRQMGYVIQSGGLFPHRSVLDNIGTVPGLLGWSKAKIRSRSLELLDSVGLDRRLASRYPAQLSGGQQQRVGVARALAADPLVLLMDEPFSAVDPVVRSDLHEFFLGLQAKLSKTIILITHDIDEAIKIGDQVAILRVGGTLAQVGTPQQVLAEPADSFVDGFIGRDRGYRALSFLPAAGLTLDSVRVVRDVASAEAGEPTLVVDADARPLGWVGAGPREAGGTPAVVPLGSTFVAERDTLRLALDSALTSPHGLAVAVSADSGRFAGIVPAAEILRQVSRTRSAEGSAAALAAATRTDTVAAELNLDPRMAAYCASPSGRAGGVADAQQGVNPAHAPAPGQPTRLVPLATAPIHGSGLNPPADERPGDQSPADNSAEPPTDQVAEDPPADHSADEQSAEPAEEPPAEEPPAEERSAEPAEEPPAEEQPAEEQPADVASLAGQQSAGGGRPAGHQPADEHAAERQSAGGRPADQQPAGERSASGTP